MTKINKEREIEARDIIHSALIKSRDPCVFFSGGKNSLVLLFYLKKYSPVNLSVIYIDAGSEFPEVRSFIQKMKKLWKFDLVIVKSEESFKEITKKDDCPCIDRKKESFIKVVSPKKYDCVFIGDTSETHNSLSNAVLEYPEFLSVIVKPLISFTSNDIWDHIRKYNLPHCSLYEKGYQKIDCVSCSPRNQIPENTLIRDDEEIIKEKLKKLGYL